MAPQKFKLTYFNLRGLAEPIRFMFAYKEVDYVDNRVKKEDWIAMKAKTPFGKLPLLEFDNQLLSESQAIGRYIARELGLYGKTKLEGTTIDMYLDALKDCFSGIRPLILEEDAAKKAEMAKKFFTETLPPYLDTMEKFLKENGGKYYVGDQVTWADLSLAYGLNELRNHNAAIFEKYPVLNKHIDCVHALPQIEAWVAKRPKTEF